jgi:hypothetical protein
MQGFYADSRIKKLEAHIRELEGGIENHHNKKLDIKRFFANISGNHPQDQQIPDAVDEELYKLIRQEKPITTLNEKEDTMERTPVKSSNVDSVGYDETNRVLEIGFKSGGIYQYSGVEPQTHLDLMGAESIGKFVNQNIVRAGFKSRKMDPTEENEGPKDLA